MLRGVPTVRIDPEVIAELAERARPGETPNTVLRRILRLPKVKQHKLRDTLRARENNR